MSASAIPHVIAFLTKPLVAVAPAQAIATAQLILNASLPTPAATLSLSPTSAPPPALLAASIGSTIPWAVWLQALGGGRDVLVFYGPGYIKVRLGDAPVSDVWSEETQGSVVPISHARLRATLLSARLRSVHRVQQEQPKTIRIPTLLADDDSSSDCESDAGSERSTGSSLSSYSTDSATTAADSECSSPVALKASSVLLAAPPLLYRAPPRRTAAPAAVVDRTKKHLFASVRTQPYRAPALRPRPTPSTKTASASTTITTTTYLYQGGVTRVMTGGVMLGSRAAVVSKRS
ncbi:hypothetical protein FB45DRAFT_1005249 [Roridomyces roridus]|uniref:Uncharacterized protein n=1 Tax=Roridomyces roridus TaxID=1738132 RepID=A0AAD7FIP3_9AGAR|nr:hypothetical protein FB45DRAFT_1005249 [Roridomyces roridus]